MFTVVCLDESQMNAHSVIHIFYFKSVMLSSDAGSKHYLKIKVFLFSW